MMCAAVEIADDRSSFRIIQPWSKTPASWVPENWFPLGREVEILLVEDTGGCQGRQTLTVVVRPGAEAYANLVSDDPRRWHADGKSSGFSLTRGRLPFWWRGKRSEAEEVWHDFAGPLPERMVL